MDQLICTSRNIRFFFDTKKDKLATPEIEAVLTVMDRTIEFVGTGIVNVEKTKSIRFIMNPEAARKLSDSLVEWADEAEEKAEKINEALKDFEN